MRVTFFGYHVPDVEECIVSTILLHVYVRVYTIIGRVNNNGIEEQEVRNATFLLPMDGH